MQREVSWKHFFSAGIITLIIFVAGIYFGLFIEKEKIITLQNSLQDIQISQTDAEMQMNIITMLSSKQCSLFSNEIEKIITPVTDLGKDVEFYESNQRFDDPLYQVIKKAYTITLAKYWLFTKNIKENCNTSIDVILYFYSNKHCTDCSTQGSVLSYIKEKYPSRAMIFAFDSDLNLDTLDSMKVLYNITQTPSLVINEHPYHGFQSFENITTILNITTY